MADVDLKGKTVVVTGASLGIGRATAIAVGRAGANVVVNYRSHDEQAEQVVQTIRDAGSQAIKIRADVSDQSAVEQMIADTAETFGRVDMAVTNAVYSDREPFLEADMDGFRRTIEVTMWGSFHLLRAACQQMVRQGDGGAIVIVSSPLSFLPAPNSMAYNMAKAAIDQMARTAAIEVAEHGIRVNIMHPGWIDTPGERKFVSEDTLRGAGSFIPMKRLGTAEEIAEGILFMLDPRRSYMTGATLLIDGGICLPWWWGQSRELQ
jgi:glucose 1-dehydrogenase